MMRIAVIFLCSILSAFSGFAQQKRKPKFQYQTVRFGFDPVRSITFPFIEKKFDNHKIYLRGFELTTEVIFNIKSSLCLEGGYEYAHRRLYNSTVDYFSEGTFLRAGLNYKMSPKKAPGEYGIGWRVGINKFTEERKIRLYGRAWDSELITMEQTGGVTMWGEILAYSIKRLSRNEKLKNFYFGGDFRLLFMNHNTSLTKQYADWLPGFGPIKQFSANLHLRLVYQIPSRYSVSK